MFGRIITQPLAAVLTAGLILFYGCSGDDKNDRKSAAENIIDTVAAKVAEDFVEAAFASAAPAENFVTLGIDEEKNVSEVNEILILDSILYAATDDGVLEYDFRNESIRLAGNGCVFMALVSHDGKLYAGGEGLYVIDDNGLRSIERDFEGTINSLLSDSDRLLIGTEAGLFSKGTAGEECLLDAVCVTALKFDKDGLWVGTDGQGLYRWDGEEFRKRFLIRDTSIFDHVYTIDFNHDHLFVGASTGFFVYDGGRWEQWTEDMGLPSNTVKSIDASDWMVHIGTDSGVIAYFNKNLYPVKKLDSTPADVVRLMGRKIIIANENRGIVMQSGEMVKTLIESARKNEPEVLTQVADEF
jgi:ligand-binding sensor domain-containing protein